MLRPLLMFAILAAFGLQTAAPTCSDDCKNSYQGLDAVLWMQTAAEYKAAASQTYHVAEAALLKAKRDKRWTASLEQQKMGQFEKLPAAAVLDLDETVLDNSAYDARLVSDQKADWNVWMKEKNAGLVPGAKEFILFAAKKGVTPIYITNRTCDASQADDPTVAMLKKLELPIAPGGLLCKVGGNGDKGPRRTEVAKKYRILLEFGDQLGDFTTIPADMDGRNKVYEANAKWFGERWFQLPNAMYGSWLDALGKTAADREKYLKTK